ncbi:MAG: cell envelope integrity protein TolA [Pseudomonadota bacterium]
MVGRRHRIGLLSKSVLFTFLIHGILVGALFFSWPESTPAKRGVVKPIQASIVVEKKIESVVEPKAVEPDDDDKLKELEELRIQREQEKKEKKALALKKKQEEEKLQKEEQKKKELEEARKKLEEKKKKEEQQRKEQESKKRQESERKKKEEERKKLEEEKQRKLEEERKRKKAEEEKRKKEEAERKRKEAERKKKEEAERKKKEAEKRKAEEKRRKEQALRDKLEKERRAQELAEERGRTQAEAVTAMTALIDRIATAVESNWRRPQGSQSGLVAVIRVKVAPTGDVQSARVVRSSGDPRFDQSAEVAVKKASPLPFPSERKYYEFINEFDLKFNPDDF